MSENYKGNTPLHIAVYDNYPYKKIIKWLVKNGTDTVIRNNRNFWPIDIAKEKKHPSDTQRLLQKRAVTDSESEDNSTRFLHKTIFLIKIKNP